MAKRTEYVFSDQARQYLKAAGWRPSRSVPVTPYQTAYKREGLTLSSAARSFLHRFGGLLIKYALRPGHDDVLGFFADEAVQNMGHGILAQTEEQFGAGRLCPLGHYLYGMCLLLQSDDGKVYGLSDDRTLLVGPSGEEAVDNVLSGRQPQILESEYLNDLVDSEKQNRRQRRKRDAGGDLEILPADD